MGSQAGHGQQGGATLAHTGDMPGTAWRVVGPAGGAPALQAASCFAPDTLGPSQPHSMGTLRGGPKGRRTAPRGERSKSRNPLPHVPLAPRMRTQAHTRRPAQEAPTPRKHPPPTQAQRGGQAPGANSKPHRPTLQRRLLLGLARERSQEAAVLTEIVTSTPCFKLLPYLRPHWALILRAWVCTGIAGRACSCSSPGWASCLRPWGGGTSGGSLRKSCAVVALVAIRFACTYLQVGALTARPANGHPHRALCGMPWVAKGLPPLRLRA